VRFSRNKKPERLIARMISMVTEPGDWVLDPFAGSGTGAAVAHKMGRHWVAIEEQKALFELCVERLSRVVTGADPTGVTAEHGWKGGSGFDVFA
jgi:adenine-specific DNA-methyltransferase